MLYILSGEDKVSSRNKLIELIEGVRDTLRIDGKKQSVADVENQLSAGSLFSNKKTLVIEYFSKIKPQAELIKIIKTFAPDQNVKIIMWDEDDLDKKLIEKFGSAKTFPFPFPKLFYLFLDGFSPKSGRAVRELLDRLLKNASAKQLVYSLIKRLRQLMILKTGKYQEFEEFKKMADWQIGKLTKQAVLWTEGELREAFLKFAVIDEKIKTGGLSLPLAKHLDILLLSELN